MFTYSVLKSDACYQMPSQPLPPIPFPFPPPRCKAKVSYTGHPKTAVLGAWQKCLQKQQYEEACHWTAELDASGWQADIWQKLIVYASKHVHMHCPKLPLLLARNYAYYQLYLTQHAQRIGEPTHQPRNHPQLQQNLCQLIGLVTLSSKGPMYTLPSIDVTKVDDRELVIGTHAWLMPHKSDADNKNVLRMLSTMLCHVENKCTHKMFYWLSVLVEYDKHQKKNKAPITMAGRKPLLPDDRSYKHVYLEGANATDWVWLLWLGLAQGTMAFSKPRACADTLKALCYLFSLDYTTSKRNTRMPLLLHALQLVCADADWGASVYQSVNVDMISKACANVHLLYQDIVQQRAKLVEREREFESQLGMAPVAASKRPPVNAVPALQTIPSQQTTKSTIPAMPNRRHLSADSNKKFNVFDQLDATFLGA